MKIEIEVNDVWKHNEHNGLYKITAVGSGNVIAEMDSHLERMIPRDADLFKHGRLISRHGEFIKDEPLSLEGRVKAEFPGKQVVMLEFMQEGDDKRESLKVASDDYSYECPSGVYHEEYLSAQAVKGFYKYVYEVEDGSFYTAVTPVLVRGEDVLNPCAVLHPCAVLFSVQSWPA